MDIEKIVLFHWSQGITYWHSSSVCLLSSVHQKNFPLNNWTAMTAKINWNSMYTIRMLMTFFSEFTTQSNTAFNFGTRLIVFSGRSTRRTLSDLMVDKLFVISLPPSPLKGRKNLISKKSIIEMMNAYARSKPMLTTAQPTTTASIIFQNSRK